MSQPERDDENRDDGDDEAAPASSVQPTGETPLARTIMEHMMSDELRARRRSAQPPLPAPCLQTARLVTSR